jgi:hypothetical protein
MVMPVDKKIVRLKRIRPVLTKKFILNKAPLIV